MSDKLGKLRATIDALDGEILERLGRRAQVAREIGHLKDGRNYAAEREAQVLRRVRANNPGPLPGDAVARIFREIMSACLALEKPLGVAHLGPRGTFSEAAALKHFGHGATALPCASIDEVFRMVEAGSADYGLAPVENSTEGQVGRTLDLMLQSPLKVCGEVMLAVHQNLLVRSGGLRAIGKIFSHAQSFAQCQEWLNKRLPGVAQVPVASNAEAARLAARTHKSAAIASEAAAQQYRLKALARNIEDDPKNTTRFVVLALHDAAPSGKDKTSLVMSAENRPGAVHALLSPLAKHGVSMTRFESRPAHAGLWEYVFFVDVIGHQREDAVARALAELRDNATFLKILGSYPAAVL